MKEETGLSFTAEFYGIFDEIIPEKNIPAVVLAFTGQGTGELTFQPEEVSETGWFSLEEALQLPLAFDHHSILAAYAAGPWRG